MARTALLLSVACVGFGLAEARNALIATAGDRIDAANAAAIAEALRARKVAAISASDSFLPGHASTTLTKGSKKGKLGARALQAPAPDSSLTCNETTVIIAWINAGLQNCYTQPSIGAALTDPVTNETLSDCAPGFYCPNVCPGTTGVPTSCLPNQDCFVDRLGSKYCPAQGVFEPTICAPGYYCPTPREQYPCPEGTLCMRGSTSPTPCEAMSYCPPLTQQRRYYGGLVIALIVDLFLAGLFFLCKYKIEPSQWAARRKRRTAELAASESGSGLAYEMTATPRDVAAAVKAGAAEPAYSLLDGEAGGAAAVPGLSLAVPMASPRGAFAGAKAVLEDGFRRCNAGLRLDIGFSDLSYTVPPPYSKTILQGVTGSIRSGRVTAVMGPSGAGKSTFISVLQGKYPGSTGLVTVNGHPDSLHRYKKMIGFVPQDDVMQMELTVRENIEFAARVRLPRHGWSAQDIARHVDAVIEVLGLGECADALSATVSGGQRKRTNIGMELAAAPAAIFLDEPTSGLDATAALEVCRTLRAIADLGLTIVAVIHQPRLEIFRSFDDLLLLAPGGQTVFMGPQRLALPYFCEHLGVTFQEGFNPADDLLDFVAGKAPGGNGASAEVPSRIRAVEMGYASSMDGSSSPPDSLHGSVDDAAFASGGGGAAASGKPLDDSAVRLLSPSAGGAPRSLGSMLCAYWTLRGSAVITEMRASEGGSLASVRSAVALLDLPGARTVHGLGSLQSSPAPTPVAGVFAAGGDMDGPLAARFDPDRSTVDRGASWLRQAVLCHNRSVLQQYRQITSYSLELGVAMLAGGMMGMAATALDEIYKGVLKPPYIFLSPAPMEALLPSVGLYVALAIGIAASPAGVRTFGEERQVFWREASSGHSTSAYYFAKTTSMVYRFTLGALHFSAIFHFLAKPATPFPSMYGIVWLQYFAVYGLAAITSMVVKRENSALLGVIASLVMGCLCGYGPNLNQGSQWGMRWLQDSSYARWASEAFFDVETRPYRALYMVEEVSAPFFGYTLDRFPFDVGMVILIGIAYRVVAYGLLIGLNREKQR